MTALLVLIRTMIVGQRVCIPLFLAFCFFFFIGFIIKRIRRGTARSIIYCTDLEGKRSRPGENQKKKEFMHKSM